jgi:hypothetical protein
MHPSTPQTPLPPPPPLWSFLEYSFGRIALEAAIGASAGWFLARALGGEGNHAGILGAAAGAVLAPLALLLTPSRGGAGLRAFRYGLALAVLGTLLLSFTGPGRDRPLDELVLGSFFFFGLGAVGHGLVLLSVRDAGRIDRDEDEEA